jgi:hypothetical protein
MGSCGIERGEALLWILGSIVFPVPGVRFQVSGKRNIEAET